MWVHKDGQLLQTPALNISSKLCSDHESGMLGVAVDPDFGTAGQLRLPLLHFQEVRRVPDGPEPGEHAEPCQPGIALRHVRRHHRPFEREGPDRQHSFPTGQHNAGDLSFGKDGHLYVTVGDGQCDYAGDSGCRINNDASRDPHILLGKILRITRNGGIPATNPYTGTDSARCNVTGRTDPARSARRLSLRA